VCDNWPVDGYVTFEYVSGGGAGGNCLDGLSVPVHYDSGLGYWCGAASHACSFGTVCVAVTVLCSSVTNQPLISADVASGGSGATGCSCVDTICLVHVADQTATVNDCSTPIHTDLLHFTSAGLGGCTTIAGTSYHVSFTP
jgi:hypothetical protein